jgi:allantoinase
MASLSVRSERVALPDGIRAATIQIRDGQIVGIAPYSDNTAGVPQIDAGALVILPGLVDSHVHINDPGRSDWEGFEHATRAAAAGGVTTLIDMPLNSIPATTTIEGFAAKREAAAERCFADVGFWGGVVPGNANQLAPLARGGVRGFKCFLSPSGVDEFAHVSEADLREALPVLAALNLPLLVHAELPALLRDPLSLDDHSRPDPRCYATWLRSRPAASEHAAIEMMVGLAREFGARVHIVHLAAADALPVISAGRHNGARVTVETCPHYLTFAAEEIGDGATAFKCAPPIRERDHREGLWQGLTAREIDFIATDHSPAPPAMKCLSDGDFVRAWGGIASLQLGLAAVWTGMVERGLAIDWLPKWLSAAPAALSGLEAAKGAIVPGHDADLVLWNPDAVTKVDGTALYHRHPITPYDGAELRGRVRTTILRGEIVFDEGECKGSPKGRLL